MLADFPEASYFIHRCSIFSYHPHNRQVNAIMPFPHIRQVNLMDCGPTCIQIVCRYYGKKVPIQYLRSLCGFSRQGVSLLGISNAVENIGFKAVSVTAGLAQLMEIASLPCIIHWEQNHFVVVYKIHRGTVYISDPSRGRIRCTTAEFIEGWCGSGNTSTATGIVLLMEPTDEFFNLKDNAFSTVGFNKIYGYLRRYRRLLLLLLLGSFLGSGLQLLLPYITQSVVDSGVIGKDLSLIFLFLLAQLAIVIGNSLVDFTRNWVLLYVSTRIGLSLLADFWTKLLRLPISYFEKQSEGHVLQLVSDHTRIDAFLSGPAITIFFSLSSSIVLGTILFSYDPFLFSLFITGSIAYACWVLLFLRVRKRIDSKKFAVYSKNQSLMVQIIHGVQDIRLSNSESFTLNEWGKQQVSLFGLTSRSLRLSQLQQGGGVLISHVTNILISYFAAKGVIAGDLTLGSMLAIQLIVGQLNSPVIQTINFFQSLQDVRLTLDRINDVHDTEDEEPFNKNFLQHLPANKAIRLENISFSYSGSPDDYSIHDINLIIPPGKVTAIVGASGSGKTTLLKLLLMFHRPSTGKLLLADSDFSGISPSFWRSRCGVVMQDGYIFNDTIAQNIAVGVIDPDREQLSFASRAACIEEFIESLPLGYQTVIGAGGTGLSMGQKQRILIARAIFKDPAFMFLDEATNALDTSTEHTVMKNLRSFYKNRTVVVVAHRLSTVIDADQIIVLSNGRISEVGNHSKLSKTKGQYYHLVKNQLELGQ